MVMTKKKILHKTSSNKPKCQNNHKKVLKNNHGGFYMNGVAFSESKWLDIINVYSQIIEKEDKCTQKRLAFECKISFNSAKKSI